MKTNNVTRLFYQGEAVRTVVERDCHHTLIKNAFLPLAELKTGGEVRRLSLLASDILNSVVSECDEDAHKVAYTPYGFQEGLTSLIGFAGERRSALPAGYFLGNGYRFFTVALMRFNSPDNLSPFGGGGINAYAYCAGDPVNRTDPSGHIPYYVNANPSKWRFYTLLDMVQIPDPPPGLLIAQPDAVKVGLDRSNALLKKSNSGYGFAGRAQTVAKKRPGSPDDGPASKRSAFEQGGRFLESSIVRAVGNAIESSWASDGKFYEHPTLKDVAYNYLKLRVLHDAAAAGRKFYREYSKDLDHYNVQRFVINAISEPKKANSNLPERNANVRRQAN